jgi:hypothetical protein
LVAVAIAVVTVSGDFRAARRTTPLVDSPPGIVELVE